MTVSIQELERRREDVPSASRADPSGGSSVLVYACASSRDCPFSI